MADALMDLDDLWAVYPPAINSQRINTSREALPPSAPDDPRRRRGAVAVIPIYGVLTPRPSMLHMLFGLGALTPDSIVNVVEAAMNDSDVNAIVLDVDSPGGSVAGIPEAADRLSKIRASATKPIIAISNQVMASGAYWLAAAAAHEIVATPSSITGSIGVISSHVDASGFYEQIGINVEFIVAGQYKAESADTGPLSESARAHVQGQVDYFYGLFVSAVARGRGVSNGAVRSTMGEGRVLVADAARDVSMVDRVESMNALIERLQSPRQRARILQAEGLEIEEPEAEPGEEPLAMPTLTLDAVVDEILEGRNV